MKFTARDAYGYLALRARRYLGCRCAVPCQKSFRCPAKRHRGSRSTPWCRGGEGELCNECWCIADARKKRDVEGK